MLTFAIVALLASSCIAIPSKPRIVGGSEAEDHSHPWQASLEMRGSHICGASIISNEWLVTAAHCVDGSRASQLTVAVAEHDLDVSGERTHQVSKIVMHENYNGNGAGFPNDIALLKVSTPINLNSKAVAIDLATMGMDFVGNNNCWITGWGLTQGSQDRTVLQELRVDVRTQSACSRAWGSRYINSGHICVENGDTGACNGDSGGPMVCYVNGRPFLAGATSWGISGCTTRGYPSVYTRISYFNSWIQENMAMN